MYTISIHNYHSFCENVMFSKTTGQMLDTTVFGRIRYFSNYDFGWNQESQVKPYFVVMQDGKKIIGLIKIGYYSNNNFHEKDYSISFISIDIEYRNKGLSRLMIDELFKFASQQGLEIQTSTYSYCGFLKIRKLFNEYSAKHGVKFTDKKDNDYLMDCASDYDENLIYRYEIDREECLKNEGCNTKKVSGFFTKFLAE